MSFLMNRGRTALFLVVVPVFAAATGLSALAASETVYLELRPIRAVVENNVAVQDVTPVLEYPTRSAAAVACAAQARLIEGFIGEVAHRPLAADGNGVLDLSRAAVRFAARARDVLAGRAPRAVHLVLGVMNDDDRKEGRLPFAPVRRCKDVQEVNKK